METLPLEKKSLFQFNKKYFWLAVLFFLIEVCIALFIHDTFIRPYFGDTLVVILIYLSLKSFLRVRVLPTAFFVLLFAYGIELLQYFQFVSFLGLEKSTTAATVLGNSFESGDFTAYTAGFLIIVIVEKWKGNSK